MNNQWPGNSSTNPVAQMDKLTRRRLVLRVREQATLVLTRLIAGIFEHVEDTLLGHAEKASSEALQDRFIHAAHELGQLRKPVSSAFVLELQKKLDNFFAAESAAGGKPADDFQPSDENPGALSNNAELEEDLAIMAVIVKGEKQYQDTLEQLTALWASFTGRQTVSNAENPVGPDSLADQFRVALAIWPSDQIVKPVIYDVFYEHVIAHLGELYRDLIDEMRTAGVQPVLKRSRRRSTSSTSSPAQHATAYQAGSSAAAVANASETSVFGLGALLGNQPGFQRQALDLPATASVSGEQLTPMPHGRLVSLLSRLQQRFTERSPVDLHAAVAANDEFKLTLHNHLKQLAEQQHQRVHSLDQYIIDIVMMLFDFVLEDPEMPAAMKLILVRLQIPVLQMAIQDKAFLSDRSHPARSLLNNLSGAAIHWMDDGDYSEGSLYYTIQQTVSRILVPREQSTELYADVNKDFSHYLRIEELAAKIAEERLGQVSRGQERLAAAREKVTGELETLMRDQVPVAAYKILTEAWRDVLTLTLLREGEGSMAWVKMLKVAQRLVDTVTPKTQEWERQKIMHDIPLLLTDLRRGFLSISYDTAKTASMLKQLQMCHISVLRGIPPDMQSVSNKHEREQLTADTEYIHDDSMLMAESVETGQWLSWTGQGGGEVRAKLSWRSELADLLLFVDNQGRKVIEMTAEELNDLFQDAGAHVIHEIDEPIMDRAMRAVHGMLRQKVSEQSSLSV